MKAIEVTLLIINHDEVTNEEIKDLFENGTHYPNHCIAPLVMSIKEADIGDWNDDHPLNKKATWLAEYERLFKRNV